MLDFLTDHPFLTMSVYILMLTAVFTFLTYRWVLMIDRWAHRNFKKHEKRMKDDDNQFLGPESYKQEGTNK